MLAQSQDRRIVSDTYRMRYGQIRQYSLYRDIGTAHIVSGGTCIVMDTPVSVPPSSVSWASRLWKTIVKTRIFFLKVIVLTFFLGKKTSNFVLSFFSGSYTMPGRIGWYHIGSDTDKRIVAKCFYRIVSSRIHVSSYRIRRIGGLRWRIVQLCMLV